ncbi:MAG: polysaccharide biosynthesis tyrosine autokinase [Chloroflexi bacterium]|nr:polysaccharide biosynthesis tyrosine autokinase [Chloroflexota bacterium]
MGEDTLDLGHYLSIVLRRWWIILLVPLVAGVGVFTNDSRKAPVYAASTLLLVQETQSGLPSRSDPATSEKLTATYRVLITTRPILDQVILDFNPPLSPGSLQGRVTADPIVRTQLLSITVRDGDPERAARLANAVAATFIRVMTDNRLAEIARLQSAAAAQGLAGPDLLTAQMSALGSLTIAEEATPPGSPVFPRTRSDVFLAVFVGILLAVVVAFVLEYLHDTVQSGERLQQRFGVVNLGTLPAWPQKEIGRFELWIRARPSSGYAEALRHIRSSLQFVTVSHPTKVLLVTSPGPSEGKSTVAANLAMALAEGGLRTVLVDLDLRRPSGHRFFGLDNSQGVTTYLARPELTPEAVLRESGAERLKIVTSGPIPPNPSELLSTPRMESLLRQLMSLSDIVVLDTPPLLVVADAALLAPRVDSALLVTEAPRTRMDSVRLALEGLRKANVPVFTVVNKLKLGWAGYAYPYRYYRYYRYRSYYRPREEEAVVPAASPGANGRSPTGLLGRVRRRILGGSH